MKCIHYFAKGIKVPVIINLDGAPTRRLLGDVAAATPAGALPAQLVFVIEFDTARPFLSFAIKAVTIFLLFDIPASFTCMCKKQN